MLSVFSTFFSYLFFHYLLNIEISAELSLHLLVVGLASSFLLTWLCQTYRGVIRHATLAELMRVVYAMLLKACVFVAFANFTQEYSF